MSVNGLEIYTWFLNDYEEAYRTLNAYPNWKKGAEGGRAFQVGKIPNQLTGGYEERRIPHFLADIKCKVEIKLNEEFDQIIVTEYLFGHGPKLTFSHPYHYEFGNVIACVSFGSEFELTFTNPHTNEQVNVMIPDNCLYVAKNEARSTWFHKENVDKFKGSYRRTRYVVMFLKNTR